MPAAIVFAAVPLAVTPRLRARLSKLQDAIVIAADDGATTALRLGLTPVLLVGDLDSVEPGTLARLREAKVAVETYPRDKDATDGQLAIERALEHHPSELVLVGFLGGTRLDMALANVLLLTRVDVPTVLLDERNECVLLRPWQEHVWTPEPDELISLLPLGGDVEGVHTRGLRWPLSGERLRGGDTRGVSNEAVANQVAVSIAAGRLLVTRHFPR